MRRLVLPCLLALTACSKSTTEEAPKPPLPLDERLAAGQARAGLISKESELIGGPVARGKVGDYKLYNSKVAVVIARPEDSRGFNPYGGVIVDADVIRPVGEQGRSRFGEVITGLDLLVQHPRSIEVISDGRDGGEARLRVHGEEDVFPLLDTLLSSLITTQKHELDYDVDYVLAPDSSAVRFEFKLFNHGTTQVEIGLPVVGFIFGDGAVPFVPGFGFRLPDGGDTGDYYGAVADDVSYIFGRPDAPITYLVAQSGISVGTGGDSLIIRARERIGFGYSLLIGDGDLGRTQELWRAQAGTAVNTGVRGRITDSSGAPLAGARVHVLESEPRVAERDYVSMTRAGADGAYSVSVPAGSYKLQVLADAALPAEPRPIEIASGFATADFMLSTRGRVRYQVSDGDGKALPVKLSMIPIGRGVTRASARFGEADRPSGIERTEYGYTGAGVVEAPAGRYTLIVSRGVEYEIDTREIEVPAGGEVSVQATLRRVVDTTGWQSTDTHVHSQMSPDSWDLFPFKVKTMVVEGLEIPVSTEHETIGDFNPAIRELGVGAWIKGIIGSEVTTYTYGHFNAFPLIPDPTKPGNGRIDWYKKKPGDTFAAVRAAPGDPFLQVNHPRSASIGGYFSAMGFDPSTFEARRKDDFSMNFDAIEVANGCGVGGIESATMPDWFSFLDHGVRRFATGATDSHHAGNGEMGFPRTYVRLSTDDPSQVSVDEVRAATKAGRMIVVCGPFVEIKIGSAEIGDTARLTGDLVRIDARVSAPSWMDVDQLEVVTTGGRVAKTVAIPESTSPVRFQGTVTASVTGGRDGWVIVRVRGDRAHGVWARNNPSYSFTNPIFLDGDGDGAWK